MTTDDRRLTTDDRRQTADGGLTQVSVCRPWSSVRDRWSVVGRRSSAVGHPSFLTVCPTFYGVNYEINPWMHIRRQPNRPRALRQWLALKTALEAELGAKVFLCRARPGLPDMTFTANAGLVCGKTFIPSRFRYKERAGEETHFTRWFRCHGYHVVRLSGDHRFEGAGDALFLGGVLMAGYYFRTDVQTHAALGEMLSVRVLSLQLCDERFYHLDTCLCPLGEDSAIYYARAFDRYANRLLKERTADLLAVNDDEAHHFACNSIVVGRKAIIPKGCPVLERNLRKRGFRVFALDLSEFLKAGGSARCLTLRLT